MSLSGTIGEIGLSEIVRLIARSGRTGLLRVTDGRIEGQVYLEAGAFTYATSRFRNGLFGELVRLGLVEERHRSQVERRKASIEDVLRAGVGPEQLREFLMEQIVEVLVRLLRVEHGRFEFEEDLPAQYATGQTFPVDGALAEAEARLERWREIEQVIPSPQHSLCMVPQLAGKSVEVDAVSWSLLAALGQGSSLEEVVRLLGMWQYPVAVNLARLVRQGLVEVAVPEELPPQTETTEPQAAVESAGTDEEAAPSEAADQEQPPSELMRRWLELRSHDDRHTG